MIRSYVLIYIFWDVIKYVIYSVIICMWAYDSWGIVREYLTKTTLDKKIILYIRVTIYSGFHCWGYSPRCCTSKKYIFLNTYISGFRKSNRRFLIRNKVTTKLSMYYTGWILKLWVRPLTFDLSWRTFIRKIYFSIDLLSKSSNYVQYCLMRSCIFISCTYDFY